MLRSAAQSAILLYQRWLSPAKGFGCAYRLHTGGVSCSVLGLRAIRRYGVWHGTGVLRLRLDRCGVAHRRHASVPLDRRGQRGFCDIGCDLPCDACDLEGASSCCDAASCGDCGDPWRSKTSAEEEKTMYIPPASRRSGRTGARSAPVR